MLKTEGQNDDVDDNAESRSPIKFEIILGGSWCCGQFFLPNRQNIFEFDLTH